MDSFLPDGSFPSLDLLLNLAVLSITCNFPYGRADSIVLGIPGGSNDRAGHILLWEGQMAEQARRKVTIPMLNRKMREGECITQLAAYDYRTAVVSDRLGMDILCVSDTGGMILFGHQSTVSVSFDEVMMMAQAIDRGSQYGLRMVDMPYWSFHVSTEQAVENAGRFVHEANAEVMKCEGNQHHARNIEAIVKAGIPVQGHIGITPMRMPQLGGFIAQGKTADKARALIDDAQAFVDAGCFSILCEVTTEEVCQYLTETLPVPVISLGAGNKADGVHIISSDLFHLWEEHVPRHSKIYEDLIPIMERVITGYMDDVKTRAYPGPEHTVYMADDELAAFAKAVKWDNGMKLAEQRKRAAKGSSAPKGKSAAKGKKRK
ncbi:MAG: 3-methyl-2-oxobutanoate hydroxymethyltransferase [Rhodospirillaceae bacterium]